jgi:hypothetical protein
MEDKVDFDVLMDDLPAGIFPEAHPESCYHALRQQGLACTRLNAELFYEMDQISRNRRSGCSTEELREIDLWDPCSETSIWNEPISSLKGHLITPEDRLDNHNRVTRWCHVEQFLRQVYLWCRQGRSPELLPHRHRQGRPSWRFRELKWTSDGIQPIDTEDYPAEPQCILQAAWHYLFRCRRRWLNAHTGKIWLPGKQLHLIRRAFQALLTCFAVDPEEWPEIREAPDPRVWVAKLEAELADLQDKECRAIRRLQQLSLTGGLTAEKLRNAIEFLDHLSEKMAQTQRRLEENSVRGAREQASAEELYGLSPAVLLELKEELNSIRDAAPEPREIPPFSLAKRPLEAPILSISI